MVPVGSHLGWGADMTDTIFVWDHPRTIVTKFGSNCPCGFREEEFSHRSNDNLWRSLAAILDRVLTYRTLFFKGTTQELLELWLVAIGQVVSERKIF